MPGRNPPSKGVVHRPWMRRIESRLETIGIGGLELGLMDAEADRRSDDFWRERQGGHDGPRSERAIVGAVRDAARDIILKAAFDAVQLERGRPRTLGIEEQRVRTIIDFVDPPEARRSLGHDYRVIVHITIWKADDVLTVPVGALFRQGDDWAVFAVRGSSARATIIKIGQRNNRTAEVLSGLAAGDRVVLHPSDRVTDGVTVAERGGIG